MVNIAIFASGRGSNFSALVEAQGKGELRARISLLVCDNPQAKVLARARKAKVDIALIKREDFVSKCDFEAAIIKKLREYKIGLIVMAGFMRILGPDLIRSYKNRIINIHPALLPAFKGAHGILDAYKYGVKVTGITVHFVDEKMDHGPIILQGALDVRQKESLAALEARMHKLEHQLYPLAVKLFVGKKLKIQGRKVKVLP